METPWSKAKKTRSQIQEAKLGARGKPQINSGRTSWTSKRDAKLYDELLVEARTTEKQSISISYSEWKDIRRQAQQTPPGLLPAMHLEIKDLHLLVLEDRDAEDFFNRMIWLEGRVKDLEGAKTDNYS
jgi:hypothetical protein